MATHRRAATSRPKAKKAARTPKSPKKPVARLAKPAARKPASRPALDKKAAKGKPVLVAKPGKGAKVVAKVIPGKGGKAGKPPRPPAEVKPIGVLPPESISRAPHRPAKPIPIPVRAPVRPVKPQTGSGAQPVTKGDYKEFEQRLLGERSRVMKEMGHYENTVLKVNQRDSAGDLSGYSFHMADVGTDAMEREKAFQLASAEGRILLEINEALRRMARGEYGVCESCGNPILRARLEAMPTARLCLACKEKEERAARGIS
jgi:RNA polymerase-binding protein DksA